MAISTAHARCRGGEFFVRSWFFGFCKIPPDLKSSYIFCQTSICVSAIPKQKTPVSLLSLTTLKPAVCRRGNAVPDRVHLQDVGSLSLKTCERTFRFGRLRISKTGD
jgi:hypothetical protein